jgi:hypothetical protein
MNLPEDAKPKLDGCLYDERDENYKAKMLGG